MEILSNICIFQFHFFTDENTTYCDFQVEVRLAEGNNVTSGRVEVKYKGLLIQKYDLMLQFEYLQF